LVSPPASPFHPPPRPHSHPPTFPKPSTPHPGGAVLGAGHGPLLPIRGTPGIAPPRGGAITHSVPGRGEYACGGARETGAGVMRDLEQKLAMQGQRLAAAAKREPAAGGYSTVALRHDPGGRAARGAATRASTGREPQGPNAQSGI